MFSITIAECWSGAKDTGNDAKSTYNKHGESNSICINSQYKDFDGKKDSCETYAGKQSANFVYKVSPYSGRIAIRISGQQQSRVLKVC